MKKQYKQPLTEVVKVNAEQMLVESQFTLKGDSKYNGTATIESKDDVDYDEDLW